MTLPIGARLGPYEVLSVLGAGGMGEVYRARDTRLQRDVAVKVLPSDVSSDPQRLKRFEKEARAASSLNHPNIVMIHDVGQADGAAFIAMELVSGQTLREILTDGPPPIRRVLGIAAQVADGLAKAHAAGIVHRDLKPENVMVSGDGFVKILDFGLAKLTQPEDPSGATQAPTVSGETHPGIVMGTVGYMSPEQALGKPLDYRSDQFAFGAILYELATGRRAFARGSAPETLSAIIRDEPAPIEEHNALAPAPLRWIVERCLAKSAEDRYASTRDLARDLANLRDRLFEASGAQPRSVAAARRPWFRVAPWLFAGALALALGVTIVARRAPTAPPRPVRFSVVLPENVAFLSAEVETRIALAPDGQRLAFVGRGPGGDRLYLRRLDTLDARPLENTEGATSPFWSPDGRFLGFFADGKIKKMEASGGPPQVICEAPVACVPAWSRQGVILFAQFAGKRSGIWRVNAAGGEPELLLKTDLAKGETALFWPQFLPDGRHFLHLAIRRAAEAPPGHELRVGSLDPKEASTVIGPFESRVEYVEPGFLVYVRQGTLLAQPFDPARLVLRGEAVALADGIYSFYGPANAGFSASPGSVAYETGARPARVAWFSRNGKRLETIDSSSPVSGVRLSPDNRSIALQIEDPKTGTRDLWLRDLARNVSVRLTFDAVDEKNPVWSPDGRMLYYRSDANGAPDVFRLSVGAPGLQTPVYAAPGVQQPEDVSPDGKSLVYTEYYSQVDENLLLLPLSGEQKPATVAATRFRERGARFSPDGQSIAYISDESGEREVYVVPRLGSGKKVRVSVGGGALPRWRRDGRELYYVALDGAVMAVSFAAGSREAPGAPVALFHVEGVIRDWDVASDGERFLIDVGSPEPAPISVLMNWPSLVSR
ncbi:MAG: protein kinase domain-containing protein [Acidobacteriota bacterium]